jgi:hypothetical protein
VASVQRFFPPVEVGAGAFQRGGLAIVVLIELAECFCQRRDLLELSLGRTLLSWRPSRTSARRAVSSVPGRPAQHFARLGQRRLHRLRIVGFMRRAFLEDVLRTPPGGQRLGL